MHWFYSWPAAKAWRHARYLLLHGNLDGSQAGFTLTQEISGNLRDLPSIWLGELITMMTTTTTTTTTSTSTWITRTIATTRINSKIRNFKVLLLLQRVIPHGLDGGLGRSWRSSRPGVSRVWGFMLWGKQWDFMGFRGIFHVGKTINHHDWEGFIYTTYTYIWGWLGMPGCSHDIVLPTGFSICIKAYPLVIKHGENLPLMIFPAKKTSMASSALLQPRCHERETILRWTCHHHSPVEKVTRECLERSTQMAVWKKAFPIKPLCNYSFIDLLIYSSIHVFYRCFYLLICLHLWISLLIHLLTFVNKVVGCI